MNGTPIAGVTVPVGPSWTTLFRAAASPVGNQAINDGQPFLQATLRVLSGTVEYRQRGTHDSALNLATDAGGGSELPQLAAGEAATLFGRRGTGNLVEVRGIGGAAQVRFDVVAK